jgi:hypothetical protein
MTAVMTEALIPQLDPLAPVLQIEPIGVRRSAVMA